MHHGAAGEVVGAEAEDEAGRSVRALGPPHHQTMWAIGQVGEGEPDREEQHHGAELHALGDGADDEGGGDGREGQLEDDEDELGEEEAGGEGFGQSSRC